MNLKNLESMAQEYKELQRMREELDATLDALKDGIKAAMNGAEVVTAGAYKLSNKLVTSSTIDTTALKKALPDVAEAFTKTTTAARFTVN